MVEKERVVFDIKVDGYSIEGVWEMFFVILFENVFRWSLLLEFIFFGIRNGFGKYNLKEYWCFFLMFWKVLWIFNDVLIYGIFYDWLVDCFILVGFVDLLIWYV